MIIMIEISILYLQQERIISKKIDMIRQQYGF